MAKKKEENKKNNEEIEIRIFLKPDARDEEDRVLYRMFTEIQEKLPLKSQPLAKMLLKIAYKEWFLKEFGSDSDQ